jgi:hypothetical protein
MRYVGRYRLSNQGKRKLYYYHLVQYEQWRGYRMCYCLMHIYQLYAILHMNCVIRFKVKTIQPRCRQHRSLPMQRCITTATKIMAVISMSHMNFYFWNASYATLLIHITDDYDCLNQSVRKTREYDCVQYMPLIFHICPLLLLYSTMNT